MAKQPLSRRRGRRPLCGRFRHRLSDRKSEAEACLAANSANASAKFGLKLHPEKTRLIEFGRYAIDTPKSTRARPTGNVRLSGLHAPLCDDSAARLVHDTSDDDRASGCERRLAAIKAELRRRTHCPMRRGGRWLRSRAAGLVQLPRRAGQLRPPADNFAGAVDGSGYGNCFDAASVAAGRGLGCSRLIDTSLPHPEDPPSLSQSTFSRPTQGRSRMR